MEQEENKTKKNRYISLEEFKRQNYAQGYEDPEPEPSTHKKGAHTISLTVAYLIGVPYRIFENERDTPRLEIYNKLETDKNARIIRNLCRLRTALIQNHSRIANVIKYENRSILYQKESVPVDCFARLSEDGILLKSFSRVSQYLVEFNKQISDRINNCKDLFPIWINWNYIRDLFVMPAGMNEDGVIKESDKFHRYSSFYPYQTYLNWPATDEGNILLNDDKFTSLLYTWNHDEFLDKSKVSNVSDSTKSNIYDFIQASFRTVFVVDCENSDPFRLCATLKNLDENHCRKIEKIILYDDIHSASAWRILESYTNIPVEHVLIERVKQNKSLVDISLTVGTCKEFFKNEVDSFVLVSSDSDYWGLISAMPEAKFLVMLEREKTGPDIKHALVGSGIFYCYIDDFYSGDNDDIKIHALVSETKRYLSRYMRLNVNDMMEEVYRLTRANISEDEQKRFFTKYIKPMHLVIDDNGDVSFELRKK